MTSISISIKADEKIYVSDIRAILKDPRLVKQMNLCGVVSCLYLKGRNGSLDELDNSAKLAGLKQDEIKFGDTTLTFIRRDDLASENARNINLVAATCESVIQDFKQKKEAIREKMKAEII